MSQEVVTAINDIKRRYCLLEYEKCLRQRSRYFRTSYTSNKE